MKRKIRERKVSHHFDTHKAMRDYLMEHSPRRFVLTPGTSGGWTLTYIEYSL